MHVIETDVVHCARCGETHRNLFFKPFGHRAAHYTHFAACPETGEPILMHVEKLDDKATDERPNQGIKERG
jgi:hypothetical protein